MAPKNLEVVREELDKRLAGGMVVPCVSRWSLSVVIAIPQNGNPKFSVDCRDLNKVMEDYIFPITNL